MNRRMVFFVTGKIILAEAALLLLPLAVSLMYREGCALAFLISIAVALAMGLLLTVKKPKDESIYTSEGFTIVALAWVLMSMIGALPFFISGEIPNYIDCIFETVSGFTTTGASIVNDVEALSRGLLFWRSFTHWVGGMGVLVFVMAVVPLSDKRSMYIMKGEVPGPVVGKLVPKIKNTAKILYGIYIVMTAILVVLLLFGGLSLFDSLLYSFGTAGTGGFSIHAASVGVYNSVYVETVITVFMALFGVNFNIFYFLVIGNFVAVYKNEELRWYFGIMIAAILLIMIDIKSMYGSWGQALRYSSFQVSTIMTTTGYSTTNFDLWPEFSKVILLLLMFFGASAGSTAGGLKISRIIILLRSAKNEICQVQHPRSVNMVRMDGKVLPKETTNAVKGYFVIYMAIFAGSILLLALDKKDFLTDFSAVASCFNNIGPGFSLVGPTASFLHYSELSKIVLTFDMLLGRLEIFPILLALSPKTWRRR